MPGNVHRCPVYWHPNPRQQPHLSWVACCWGSLEPELELQHEPQLRKALHVHVCECMLGWFQSTFYFQYLK